MATYQPLVVASSDNVAACRIMIMSLHSYHDNVTALVSWFNYKFSNTVEQRMIPGGSNDERHMHMQYLASCEALLHAVMYVL